MAEMPGDPNRWDGVRLPDPPPARLKWSVREKLILRLVRRIVTLFGKQAEHDAFAARLDTMKPDEIEREYKAKLRELVKTLGP